MFLLLLFGLHVVDDYGDNGVVIFIVVVGGVAVVVLHV